MTDQELIERIEQAQPEQWSRKEIRFLRQRIRESDEVRAALADRLWIEHRLGDELGTARVPIEELLAQLDKKLAVRRRSISLGTGLGLALGVMLLVVGAVLWQINQDRTEPELAQGDDPQIEAEADPTAEIGNVEDAETPSSETQNNKETENNNQTADQPKAPANRDRSPEPAQKPRQPQPAMVEEAITKVPPRTTRPAAPVQPVKPWTAMLQAEPIAWVDFPWNRSGLWEGQTSLRAEELGKWLVKASDDQPGLVEARNYRNTTMAGFKGLVRLQPEWPKVGAINAVIQESRNLRFHFSHGDTGVSVICYQRDYDPWYSFVTTLAPGKILPEAYRLTASDDYRVHRSEAREASSYAFFYDEQSAEIVIYRGEVEAVRAPLPGPPDTMLWQGEAIIDQLAIVPLEDLPVGPSELPLVSDISRPGDLDWKGELPEKTEWHRGDNGELILTTDKAEQGAWVAAPIPGHGLRMVEFEIEGIDNAVSLFLATSQPPLVEEAPQDDDQPKHRIDAPRDGIVFATNRHTGGQYARFSNCWDTGGETDRNIQDHPTAEVRDRVWVRLLAGSGQLRGWISTNGRHWALLPNEVNNAVGEYTHLGIALAKTSEPRRTILHHVRVRKFGAIHDLTTERELARVFELPVTEIPEKIDQLLEGPRQDLSPAQVALLIRRLTNADAKVDEVLQFGKWAMRQPRPLESRRQLLRELAIYGRTWPSGHHEKLFFQWLCEQPHQWLKQTESLDQYDFADYRHDLFNLPAYHRDHSTLTTRESLRDYLVRAIHEQQGERVIRACERVRAHYQTDPAKLGREHPVVGWAGSMAARMINRPISDRFYVSDQRWRWLLVEELSKEAYNISAELNAALEGEAFEDACKVITRIPPEAAFGLAPSAVDGRHLFSLPAAISMAIRNHRPLREAMHEGFSEIANLRANQAIADGNVAAAELVTLQFLGTDGATKAHVWLGDQAVAAGRFTQAMGHYRQAERSAFGPVGSALRARLRMLGGANEAQADGDVHLGSHRESPDRFTRSTRDIRGLRPFEREETDSGNDPAVNAVAVVEPGASFEKVGDPVELDWGDNPNQNFAEYRRQEIDWRPKHLALTHFGDQLVWSTRFQIACWDLAENRLRWKTPRMDQNRSETHRWPLQEMTPVSNGQRLFARLLNKDGPMLAAFELDNGSRAWELAPPRGEIFASDPFLVHGDLMCVTLKEDAQEHYVARLTRIDPALGEATWDHDLFRIHKSWDERRICQISRDGEIILANFGGVLAACDVSGQLRWIRKQITYPKNADESWVTQPSPAPLIFDGLCYTYHAGATAVECIEVETGKLRWSKFEPDLTQMAIHKEGRLLLLSGRNRLTAVEPRTASEVWTVDPGTHVRNLLIFPESILVFAHDVADDDRDQSAAFARWLAPANGEMLAETPLISLVELPENRRLELGPAVVVAGEIHSLIQPDENDARPQLITARGEQMTATTAPAEQP
ncbi:MAG: PQQ-binding-like beta-propeller repeat protein [Pirellulaceae bacterium]